MTNSITKKLNVFLKGERISKEQFDELKYVAKITEFNNNILNWFPYLQEIEIVGWRNKLVTKKICTILQKMNHYTFMRYFVHHIKKESVK